VLRRLADEQVSLFLRDSDEYIVTEAARAINDDLSIEAALPALAAVLGETRFSSEPLLRRSINAALRVGGEKELNMLISFARRSDINPVIRAEALATLGTWSSPSVLDRVDGRFRGVVERDPSIIQAKITPFAIEFLNASDTRVQIAAIDMLRGLKISDFNDQLASLMKSAESPDVRAASLKSLHELNSSEMESLIRIGMNDSDSRVRTASLGLLDEMEISAAALPSIVSPVFQKGSLGEQQQLLNVLGKMPVDKSLPILQNITDQLVAGKLDPSLTLDVFEAVETSGDPALTAKVEGLKSTDKTSVEAFQAALYGGDAGLGRQVFYWNATAQCTRCHVIRGEGSDVGPQLAGIASKLTREQLLESLIEPSARLAPGFGSVSLTLKDGQKVSGVLMEENDTELTLKTNEAEPLHIATERISERTNLPSSMPPMGLLLSPREIRDLVEFLSQLD
jgi:putative heme-binding domain-containing protein